MTAGQSATLEWTWDPDPGDDRVTTWILPICCGKVKPAFQVAGDRHVLGLFSRAMWEKVIRGAGFEFFAEPFLHSSFPDGSHEIFIGRKA